jgi:4-amino-4-deoxy-L-arabinose transferase-like glycosyltransferase
MPAQAMKEPKPLRALALLMLGVVVVWGLFWWNNRFIAQQDPDAQDYAQIAVNIHEGRGQQTSVMPLAGLEWRRQTGRLNAPWWNLHRFPFAPAMMALLFNVFGTSDLAVPLSSGLFFLASIPLVFLFGRRLFGDREGLTAAFLFAFAGGPMRESITGLTEPAATFFFLAALYLVLWPKGLWSFVLAGLLTGTAFLNRYSIVLYAVPMLWLLWSRGKDHPWRSLAAFCAPAALVTAPWLYRNYVLAGDPTFSLTTALMVRYMTAASPQAHDWYQFVYQKPLAFWAAHPAWVIQKWAMQTGDLWWNELPNIGRAPFVYPLFLLSALRGYEGQAARLRRWLLGVFLLHFLVLGLLSNIPRYYAVFEPFLCVFGAEALLRLWEWIRPRTTRAQVAWATFFGLPLLINWASIAGPPSKPKEERTWVEWNRGNQDWLRTSTPQDAVIVSDVPWSVAWYGRRRSVPLPPTPNDMQRFSLYGVEPGGIYLKAPRRRQNVPAGWDEWRRVQYARAAIPGYRLEKVFADDSVYYRRTGR